MDRVGKQPLRCWNNFLGSGLDVSRRVLKLNMQETALILGQLSRPAPLPKWDIVSIDLKHKRIYWLNEVFSISWCAPDSIYPRELATAMSFIIPRNDALPSNGDEK